MSSLTDRKGYYCEASTSASTITINEPISDPNWQIPPIFPNQVYKIHLYKYLAKSQIRQNYVDIAFTAQDKPI